MPNRDSHAFTNLLSLAICAAIFMGCWAACAHQM